MAGSKTMYIAEATLGYLGGTGRLKAMIGARNFLALSETDKIRGGVSFTLPAFGKPRVNVIKIELNGGDLYDVYFYFLRAGKLKTVAEEKDVFCDQLREVIERNTGLYLSMGKVYA